MRHVSGRWVILLLLVGGEAPAAGNNGPPCRSFPWALTGSMSTPRQNHVATLLPSGKVLVAGGTVDGTAELATAELFDPATGTWSPTGSMNVPRDSATLTLLPSGKVLVAGGFNQLEGVTRSAELYDPDTGQWSTTGGMVERRVTHTATLLPSGKVLVVGGGGASDMPGLLASAELYDPATGEWQASGTMSIPRAFHTETLLASGEALVVAGFGAAAPTDSAETYEPASGTWIPTGSMLVSRWLHTATRLSSDAVLVAGGAVLRSDGSFPSDEAELYAPATRSWRRTGSLFTAHAQHSATLLPSGRVLLVGGFDTRGILTNTELFDPESETWSDAGCTNVPRNLHTATLLGSGAVLVAGGAIGEHGATSSAEIYGILVSPTQVSLAPGASRTFSAAGGSGLGQVWSFLQNASGATLTASGAYQAGPVGGVTDVIQVVDSFANSSTATVNVVQPAATLSSTTPQAKSIGCNTSGGPELPGLGGAVLVLLGWRSRRVRRRLTG